jgi:hypothetical protein
MSKSACLQAFQLSQDQVDGTRCDCDKDHNKSPRYAARSPDLVGDA